MENGSVMATVIVCTVLILAFGLYMRPEIPEMPSIPTAQEIASQIDIPSVDTGIVNRICELTDGCLFYESKYPNYWINRLDEDYDEDFEEAVADLLNIDEDYLTINNIDYREKQVRAYTKNDKDRGSWEIKRFARVEYQDTDEDNGEVVYVLMTTTLDEGSYDEISTLVEVDRNFKF